MRKKSTVSTLKRRYTNLHEGRAPDRIKKEKLPNRPPKYFVELGPIPELMYLKKTPDGEHPYRHEFAEWAEPTLVHDEKGKLHIVDQDRLITTERGIEDNTMKRRRHHRSILRANPSHRGHRFLARHNPLNAATFKKVAVSSAAVGVGAAVVAIAFNMLLDKLATPATAGAAVSPWFTDGYKRAGLQAGAGLVIATALQSYGMDTAAAVFGVGGVSSATVGAYTQYRALHPAGMAMAPRLASVPTYAPVSAAR